MKGVKRDTVAFVRFAVTDAERELLQRACALDERCMADFARIYTMRAANALLGQNNGKNANDFIAEAKEALSQMVQSLDDEAKKRSNKKK